MCGISGPGYRSMQNVSRDRAISGWKSGALYFSGHGWSFLPLSFSKGLTKCVLRNCAALSSENKRPSPTPDPYLSTLGGCHGASAEVSLDTSKPEVSVEERTWEMVCRRQNGYLLRVALWGQKRKVPAGQERMASLGRRASGKADSFLLCPWVRSP